MRSEFVKFVLSVGRQQLEIIALQRSAKQQAPLCGPEEVLEEILEDAGFTSASVDIIPEHLANSELIMTMPAHTCVDQPSLSCPACVCAALRPPERTQQ
jgi:hypothetical protein